MRIGHYVTKWRKGGLESYVERVSQGQAAAGHEIVHLFEEGYPYFLDPAAPTPGVEALRVGGDADVAKQAKARGLDVLHVHRTVTEAALGAVPTLRTLHGHRPYCPAGPTYFRASGRPCDREFSLGGCLRGFFVDHCGVLRPDDFLEHWRYTYLERRVLPQVDVHTVSHFLADRMRGAGYSPERIHPITLFAPPVAEAVPPPPVVGTPRFVFLGRLVTNKGPQWLLRALRHVTADLHLDVLGTGELEASLKQTVEQNGWGDRVTFHGWCNRDQVQAALAAARAVVFPSIWHEPAGLVSLEAMAQARPVIAGRAGGIPELVRDGVDGLLVTPNDDQALAAALDRLATDYDYALALGQHGVTQAREVHTLERHLHALDSVYAHVRRTT